LNENLTGEQQMSDDLDQAMGDAPALEPLPLVKPPKKKRLAKKPTKKAKRASPKKTAARRSKPAPRKLKGHTKARRGWSALEMQALRLFRARHRKDPKWTIFTLGKKLNRTSGAIRQKMHAEGITIR
jgi:hypothetical protein